MLEGREIKSFGQSHEVESQAFEFGTLSAWLWTSLAFDIVDVMVLAPAGYFSPYRSQAVPLSPLCLLHSPLPSTALDVCPTLNISEDIMNIVYALLLLTWLVFSFSLSLSLCSLYRGGSLEKDKAVSSSIVSSVQSKITQVLFFAFIPNMSSTALYSLAHIST